MASIQRIVSPLTREISYRAQVRVKGSPPRQSQNSVLRLSILACLTAGGFAVSSAATAACTDPSTCFGTGALEQNSSVDGNTAFGFHALRVNTMGERNVSVGVQALEDNILGGSNTAVGYWALKFNQDPHANTAVGAFALSGYEVNPGVVVRQLGSGNSAFGSGALSGNGTGDANTAVGASAMLGNLGLSSGISGNLNVAIGAGSLNSITSGSFNTATGTLSLNVNSTGFRNTATGVSALGNLTTGGRNTAIGAAAGKALVTGNDNIIVGAQNFGVAAENGVIRIGTKTFQKKAFVAGIRGVTTGSTNAVNVFIDVNGQLGTIKSSREVKEDIQPMGSVSERLLALRPVSFRYKEPDEDGSKPVQFGLIAEEVAEAFPELVVYDEKGKPETVRYDLIATMLLNEFQKEHSATQVELAQLKKEVAQMAEIIERLDHAKLVATTR